MYVKAYTQMQVLLQFEVFNIRTQEEFTSKEVLC